MTIIWYVLTVLLGAFGILNLVRFVERLAFGGGDVSVAQLLIGGVALLLAWNTLGRARR